MTIARFEHFMQSFGMIVRDLRLIPVKGLPFVTTLPVDSASC